MLGDYRLNCPLIETTKPLFMYSLCFSLLYPIGVPFLFCLMLHHFNVPKMVRDKVEKALLSSLIHKYQKRTSSREAVIMAKLVGSHEDERYDEKVRAVFNDLDTDKSGFLSLKELVDIFNEKGMRATTDTMITLLGRHDVDP